MSDESRVWHGIDVTINWHAKYIEQVARAEKAEAEVARLTEEVADAYGQGYSEGYEIGAEVPDA